MKVRRYKKLHKNLGFFINNFGFRQPYQMLVDGTFCLAALKNKINIADNIPRYLQDEVKFLTTPCVIIEMEKLGAKLQGALKILKNYGVHKCPHKSQPITGSDCFLSMLGEKNDKHYIVATQDRDLQTKARNIPGVPLLYLHMKTPVLEQPSQVSIRFAKEKTAGLWDFEKKTLEQLKLKNNVTTTTEDEQFKRKKKKKGPNPLSCKKKKNKLTTTMTVSNETSKKNEEGSKSVIQRKKRRKIRIPEHVKQELLTNKTNL